MPYPDEPQKYPIITLGKDGEAEDLGYTLGGTPKPEWSGDKHHA